MFFIFLSEFMVRNEEYYMEQLNKFDKALSMPNKR
nr:MAG TPA: hypothetical protein [Caudoviricetes sp.]DAQ56660.1 MAG TPA: hypothetical protein [Caudoviricetes sp.]